MSIIGSNVLAGASGQAVGYEIERSLRFDSGSTSYLSKSFASAGDRKTWTLSFWMKRCFNSSFYQSFLINRNNDSYNLRFDDPTTPKIYLSFASGVNLTTTAIFRDFSAWMHVVVVYDSRAATTSTDRLKLYINGDRITAFDSISYPTDDQLSEFNNSNTYGIGYWNANTALDAYLADYHFIDGQALDASDFGEDDDDNVWQPKAYAGTYGTNGFHLDFSDNTSTTTIAEDSSGNGNDFTANNFSVTAGSGNDSLLDTPTNYEADSGNNGGNYATLNPLALGDNITLSNGNLEAGEASTSGHTWAKSTIGVKSGKWYVEVTVDSATGPNAIGLTNYPSKHTGFIGADGSAVNGFNMIYNNGTSRQIFDGNVATTNYISGGQWSTGDVLQIAYDADNDKAWFGINNTWYQADGSSTTLSAVEAGTNATFTNFNYSSEYFFTTDHHDAGFTYNFGQRAWEYAAPSGFKALCTTNLSDTTVTTSGSYTGNSDADGDGPFVYLNGVPTAMTIGGSAVTFGTDIDRLSNGFKITSATTNNTSGTSYSYSVTTAGDPFKTARAQTN